MKFENLMLHGLFLASSVVCALILAAMLHASPKATTQSAGQRLSAMLGSAPSNCSVMVDGVLCAPTASVSFNPTRA